MRYDELEAYQEALRLLLGPEQSPEKLAYQRVKVNQAHNALFNSLNQASSEPSFNAQLLQRHAFVAHAQPVYRRAYQC